VSAGYGRHRELFAAWSRGDVARVRTAADSARKVAGVANPRGWLYWDRSLALLEGRLRDYATARTQTGFARDTPRPDDEIFDVALDAIVSGPSPSHLARLDSAIARVPFRELPMIDRPYLSAAVALARLGNADKARAMIARYRAEMTDTSAARVQQPELHQALGEIALASGHPQEALAEFRRGDIGYDGAPADECAACVFFDLGRAYDAVGKADSATMMFERYLSTPYWFRAVPELDPIRVPAIRERLGQLYESMGNTEKAAENYRAFIDLWKNADAELRPRVTDARQRLTRLTPVEKPRP
jgi:tetratricopeptide (TPR) repeat protein